MRRRVAKLALLLGGLAALSAWASWLLVGGVGAGWSLTLAMLVLAYGGCGWASYDRPVLAMSVAAGLTVALAWVTFSDVRAVGAGATVTLGCAARLSTS